MRKHIESGQHHLLHRLLIPSEIRHQTLYKKIRLFALQILYSLRKVIRSPIRHIIPIHTRQLFQRRIIPQHKRERKDELTTTYLRPHLEIASDTFSGSLGSGGGGARLVFIAQKRHPRVQVSPKSMIVAVPPDQHSPMLGQRASWHTVFRFRPYN